MGPAVPVLELPRSWAEARTALRFTAEGTAQDPGPKAVYADELGGVALLAGLVAPGAEPPPDVRALEAAGAATPWLLATLHAVVVDGEPAGGRRRDQRPPLHPPGPAVPRGAPAGLAAAHPSGPAAAATGPGHAALGAEP